MFLVRNINIFIGLLLIIDCVFCTESGAEENDKQKEDTAESSSKDDSEESEEKELGTVSPTIMEKLREEILESQKEDSENFGLPLTNSPEEVEAYLNKEEKQYGKDLPEKVEESVTVASDFKNLFRFLTLFDQIENEAAGNEDEEEEVEPKSPEEMKKLKEEAIKLTNKLNERQGLPEVSREEFDQVWKQKEEENGKRFPQKIERVIALLKTGEEKEHATSPKEVESVTEEASTQVPEMEIIPVEAFSVKSAKGKVCILAKFHSEITITYSGKSAEQKVEVTVPSSGNVKGKCGGPNKSPMLQISWGKFVFVLIFNKTSEDNWSATLVELTYDTSEPLFDGAVDHGKFTAKSKKLNLFETPLGKSYFCPGQEVILLYIEDQQVATVRLKEVHLQAYDVEDGKFSPSHRCNQVVIGGPEEEPFVQDETIPLAVGCTLALITLLILVGFSVHRAYNAAKVDYNTME